MASTSNSARSEAISRFMLMGFKEKFVTRAVDAHAEGDEERILEALLSYNTPDESPPRDIEWDDDLDEVSDFSSIGCLQNEL
ncbi:hypothetical protein MKW98_014162 [Papaver atlanticum]|uniref:UBA domain-containing protein n=1 Tax=Papaver atlanticum TaxID=357466 RepID=A0AAD4XG51_9MAGN|nr:hypothetical protein MKW98_014162 [Papaver atlanticum]